MLNSVLFIFISTLLRIFNESTNLRKIHAIAGAAAFLLIAVFWSSTVISELFGSPQTVAAIKQRILYALFGLIGCMIIAGVSGMKMGGKSHYPPIAAKRRRMPIIAANGIFILLPCAFFLASRAAVEQFDSLFYAVQTLELIAGTTNLILLGLSMKQGFALRKPKKS